MVDDIESSHQVLECDLDLVIGSYRDSIDRLEKSIEEINATLFCAIRKHVDEVENCLIKRSLSATKGKIETLKTLCDNLSAMEGIFQDLKFNYSAVVDKESSKESLDDNHNMNRSLEFDNSDEHIAEK